MQRPILNWTIVCTNLIIFTSNHIISNMTIIQGNLLNFIKGFPDIPIIQKDMTSSIFNLFLAH